MIEERNILAITSLHVVTGAQDITAFTLTTRTVSQRFIPDDMDSMEILQLLL